MPVTIKDIAQEAGVSHSTVSRALREHSSIAPDTVVRIKEIAQRLGYVPSAVARGLKTNRSNALGVIVSRINDPFWSEVLQGIEDEARAFGYNLFISASNRDSDLEQSTVVAMGERRVDGIILCAGNLGSEDAQQLKKYGVPIVAVDNQSPEDYEYSIYHDHRAGSIHLANYLIDLGHNRIAYLGNPRSGRANKERMFGLRDALLECGQKLPEKYIFQAQDGTTKGGEAGGQYFADLSEPPTAIVCFNDAMAIGVIHVLRKEGWVLPENCSVVGYDNISYSAYSVPSLTTFEQPKYELGLLAAEMMLGLLTADPSFKNGKNVLKQKVVGKIIVRESAVPPQSRVPY